MRIKPFIVLLMALLLSQNADAVRYARLSDGVVVYSSKENVRLKVYSDKIIRVSATPDETFSETGSLVVLPPVAKTGFEL